MRAMLKVQAPCADLSLCDQAALLALDEGQELFLFHVVVVFAADLHGVGDAHDGRRRISANANDLNLGIKPVGTP